MRLYAQIGLDADRPDLLPQLFREIVVPELVCQEVLAGREDDAVKMALPKTHWISRKNVEITLPVAAWNLGNGESAVFSFAMKESGNCRPEKRAA